MKFCHGIFHSVFYAPLFATYYLFLFVLINTRFVWIINRFIRNLEKRERERRRKKVLIYACSTQILRINILICSVSEPQMKWGDIFGMNPLLIPPQQAMLINHYYYSLWRTISGDLLKLLTRKSPN